MNVRTSKQGRATIIMTFDIHGTEELNRITDKIRRSTVFWIFREPPADKFVPVTICDSRRFV